VAVLGAEAPKGQKRIQLTVGDSVIVDVAKPKTVVIGDSGIASVKVLDDHGLVVSGRTAGTTTLIVKYPNGDEETFVVAVAELVAEKSLIEVNVQVYEVRQSDLRQAGFQWETAVQALSVSETSIPPLFQVGTFVRNHPLTFVLDALVEKGHAKLLAKPRLLTVSGGKASFLSGGEVPVAYVDNQRLHIDYKPYGVQLDIQPTADVKGNISTDLRMEVSSIDPANSVRISNIVIPALRSRWAKTSVVIKNGVTIVIAGLIQEEELRRTTGVPLLMDIPLLGELFKSTRSATEEMELIIFVSPSIIGVARPQEMIDGVK